MGAIPIQPLAIQTYRSALVIEARQLAYLEAMDIPVWVLRQQASPAPVGHAQSPPQVQEVIAKPAAVEAVTADPVAAEPAGADQVRSPGLKLSPGAGGVMLVCARDSDSASKKSNDITRALGKMPVWAWPAADEQALSAADAVEENLFTCVAIFGEALGHLLFGDEIPSSLGSARLVLLPAMSELTNSAAARRELWSVLCRSGMIVS